MGSNDDCVSAINTLTVRNRASQPLVFTITFDHEMHSCLCLPEHE